MVQLWVMAQNNDWTEHFVFLFPVTLIDGGRARGPLMRRRRQGDRKWEYRKMTQDEETEYLKDDAW